MDTNFDFSQLFSYLKEGIVKQQTQKTFEQFLAELKVIKEQQLPEVSWSDFILLYKLHTEERTKQVDPAFFDGLSKFFNTIRPMPPSNEWPPPGFPKEPE